MSQKLNPIPLPTIRQMRHALEIKNARRPVSVTSRGMIKCSGKWNARQIYTARVATLVRPEQVDHAPARPDPHQPQEPAVTDKDSDMIEYGGGWTKWDWVRWALPWLLIGLCGGAGIVAIIDGLMP